MTTHGKEAAAANVEKRTVVLDGQEYTEVKEGLGRILIPAQAKSEGTAKKVNDEEHQKVFYNPIQQFNRDLTVLAIKAYGEDVVAKRRETAENRINKKKRKREGVEDGRQVKQEKQTAANNDEPMLGIQPADGDGVPYNSTNEDVSRPTVNDVATPGGIVLDGQEALDETHSTEANGRPGRKLDTPRFTILDALSATGLRALRYAQELPFVSSVTANDLTPSAVEAIRRNVEHNGIVDKVNVTQGDARGHMYSLIADEVARGHSHLPRHFHQAVSVASRKYDVIDLDPYGSAASFFDAAINAVRDDGGLLCVTCTDAGVWGTHAYSEKAFALYGGIPIKGYHSHEAALRLIIHSLATTAARQGLAIEPLLSLSIDYYVRIFVRVKKSPATVKFLAGKTMMVYSCDQGCGTWETQLLLRNRKVPSKGGGLFYKHSLSQGPAVDSLCKHCGTKTHLAGPMYAGPLHSVDFIKKILEDLPSVSTDVYGTTSRIEGMLQTALEETFLPPPEDSQERIKDDEAAALEPYPFFFHPSVLAGAIHCTCPDEESLRGALRRLGYEVTRSHCKPGSLKTNAPWSVIWHIMREWIRQKAPVKVEKIKEGSPAYRLLRLGRKDTDAPDAGLDEVDKLEVVFDKSLGQDKSKKGLVRYQMNPKENWGPLTRAKGH